MTETTQSTRELLASSELFGFDTGAWARGPATGRSTAARRGTKVPPIIIPVIPVIPGDSTMLDESQILRGLNDAPLTAAADASAVTTPEAGAEQA